MIFFKLAYESRCSKVKKKLSQVFWAGSEWFTILVKSRISIACCVLSTLLLMNNSKFITVRAKMKINIKSGWYEVAFEALQFNCSLGKCVRIRTFGLLDQFWTAKLEKLKIKRSFYRCDLCSGGNLICVFGYGKHWCCVVLGRTALVCGSMCSDFLVIYFCSHWNVIRVIF